MNRTPLIWYVIADAFSLLGNSVVGVVLPWLVLVRTGDAGAAALVVAAAGVAQIVGTAFVGSLVDRFGARRIAVLADLGSAASVAALALVGDSAGTAWLTVLAVAGALFDIPGMTARQTLLPRVAESTGIPIDTVSGAQQTVFGFSFLLGPAAAGLLLAVLPPAQVLWITAGCSLLAAVATLAVRVGPVAGPVVDTAAEGLPRGVWSTVRRSPVLLRVLGVAALSSLISAPLTSVLFPAFFAAADRPDLLGWTTSAFALGVLGGAIAYPLLARRSRRAVWSASLVVAAVGFVVIALLGSFATMLLGALVVGLGSGLIKPIFGVVLSERTPPAQLGRVFALSNVAALSAAPLGLAVASLLVADGLAPLAWGIAAVWVVTTVVGTAGRGLRDLEAPTATQEAQQC